MSTETKLKLLRMFGFLMAGASLVAIYYGHGYGVFAGALMGYTAGILGAIRVVDAVADKHMRKTDDLHASPQREGDRPASPNDQREREPNV